VSSGNQADDGGPAIDSNIDNNQPADSPEVQNNDTTGQGLFDVLQNELKLLDLDIDDVRGQGYDNGPI
jgi:hypothetical protein